MSNDNKNINIHRSIHGKSTAYFIHSRHSAQDLSLSFGAIGMLSYLLSKPDTWVARNSDFEQYDTAGKVRKYLKELEVAGYITKPQRIRDPKTNKFIGWTDRIVHEDPMNNPVMSVSAIRGSVIAETSPLDNTELDNTELTTLHDESCEQPTDKIIPYDDDVRMSNAVGARMASDVKTITVKPADNSIPKQDTPIDDTEAEQATITENDAMKELKAEAKRKASDNMMNLLNVIPELLKMFNGRDRNIAHMLSGTSKKAGYKEYSQYFAGDAMVTPDELSKVVDYYKRECEGLSIIQSPKVIASWVGKYRNHVKENNEQDGNTIGARSMMNNFIPQQEPEEG